MKLYIVAPLIAGCLAVGIGAPHQATADPPSLWGSFVQPALIDGWSNGTLDDEFDVMDNAGMDTLILQWTADSKHHTATFDTGLSGYTQSTTTDVVDRTLAAAESAGASVWVGLQINDDWWQNYASNPTWLGDEATLAVDLAEELYDNYGAYDSFAGWYLPFEMDNVHFADSTSLNRMVTFYDTVIDGLYGIDPSLPVAVSPFFNANLGGAQTASQWEASWTTLLASTEIDVVALQDGVGAGHATSGQLGSWFAAMASAIANGSPATLLYADTETFVIGASGLQPMGVDQVVDDINAVTAYVDGFWSFSYTHYQSPNSPFASTVYDSTYRDYLSNGTVETTVPSTPTSLSASATDSQTIALTWTASTDNVGVAGYNIYRGGSLVATQLGSATGFTDSQLDGSTTYSYTVQAFDGAGNVSAASSSSGATTSAAPSHPTNRAASRSYTSTVAADASYPDSGGELTDGVHGAALYGSAWQGRNAVGTYSFTIDLGSSVLVNSINSSWLQVVGDYVFLPVSVTYAVSSNGSSFTTVGTIQRPAMTSALQTKTLTFLGLNLSTRYVRVTVDGGSAWTMLDEVEVRST